MRALRDKRDIETPDGMYRRNRVHIRKDTVPEEAVPTAQMSAVHRQDPVEVARQTMLNADNIVRVKTSSYANRFERATLRKCMAEYVLTTK